MADFKPITTQEEFDAAIDERIRLERDSVAEKYADYDDLKKQIADQKTVIGTLTRERDDNAEKYAGYDKTVAELRSQVKGYEIRSVKMRIAHEAGIPYEMAARLSGETEEDIRKDAAALARFVRKDKYIGPLKEDAPAEESTQRASLRQMLQNLKGAKYGFLWHLHRYGDCWRFCQLLQVGIFQADPAGDHPLR